MKRIIVISIITFLMSSLMAQPSDTTKNWDSGKSNGGFMEKFGSKMQSKLKELEKKQNAPADPSVMQSLESLAQKWPANNRVVMYKPYGSSGMLKGGSCVYIQLDKNEEGYVGPVSYSLFLDEEKNLESPTVFESYINPMYVKNKWFFDVPFVVEYYNKDESIYITENSVVCYEVKNNTEPDVHDILWIGGKKGRNQTAWTKEIEAFRRYGMNKYQTDQEELAIAEKAFRAEHSLENKEVTDLKIVFTDDTKNQGAEVGFKVSFGVEATFADGTKDKTQNLGGNLYIEDFKVDYAHTKSNIGEDYQTDQWGGHCHCNDAVLNVSHYSPKPGKKDVLTFTVTPKYLGSAKQTLTVPLKYPKNLRVISPGSTVRIAAKTSKHSETGQALIFCKVGDRYQKFNEGGDLICNKGGTPGSEGQMGTHCWDNYCKAGNGGDGGNGGNGGIIYLTISPEAKGKFTPKLFTQGGPAGKAGAGGVAHGEYGTDGQPGSWGKAGKDGYSSTKVGAVSF